MILEASREATPSHCTAQGDAACRVVTGDADAKIKQSLSSVLLSASFAQACGPTAPPDTHGRPL